VNTACPRVVEDYDRIRKPILNAEEVKEITRAHTL